MLLSDLNGPTHDHSALLSQTCGAPISLRLRAFSSPVVSLPHQHVVGLPCLGRHQSYASLVPSDSFDTTSILRLIGSRSTPPHRTLFLSCFSDAMAAYPHCAPTPGDETLTFLSFPVLQPHFDKHFATVAGPKARKGKRKRKEIVFD